MGLVAAFCTCCSLSRAPLEIPKAEPAVSRWNLVDDCEEYVPGREMLPSRVQGETRRLRAVPISILDDDTSDENYDDEQTCMELLWDELWWPDNGLEDPGALGGLSTGGPLP